MDLRYHDSPVIERSVTNYDGPKRPLAPYSSRIPARVVSVPDSCDLTMGVKQLDDSAKLQSDRRSKRFRLVPEGRSITVLRIESRVDYS